MRKFSTLIAAGIAAAAIAAPTHAAEQAMKRDLAEIFTECGLGGLIAKDMPAVAAITNITWDLGTTAIASELSSAESCKGGEQKMAAFLIQNQSAVETALATGEGAHLDALVALGQCQGDLASVKSDLRADFAETVATEGYQTGEAVDRSAMIYNLVDSQASCQIIS